MANFICSSPTYKYKGWLFEVPGTGSPWPITRDLIPCKRAGRVFYAVVKEWDALPDKEKYYVAGGCWRF